MVHRCFLSLICAACWISNLQAEDTISPKTLAAIKRATVYIKVDVQGIAGSGSGFVVHTDKDEALIVTNHHVVEPKIEVMVQPRPSVRVKGRPHHIPPSYYNPRLVRLTLKDAAITVVFDSGTKKERLIKADVVAIDPEHDLAVLRVNKVQDLPEPIDAAKVLELAETMPVYTFGFPFGKVLATGKGGPAITVGKAAISSLRENDDGELAYVQIDGSLNPGNSGGPMVDVHGRLVGVAVATIRNSSGIGLAIPGAEVRKMLRGRLGSFHLTTSPPRDGKVTVTIDVGVVDPLHKVKTVTLHYLPASSVADLTKQIDSLQKLPGAQKIELSVEKHLATGKLVVEASAQEKGVLLQAVLGSEADNSLSTGVVHRSLKNEPAVVKGGNPPGVDLGGVDGATRVLGGAFDPQFKDEAPAGGLLIGFEFGMGKFFDNDVIKAVRPIYRAAKDEEAKGKQYGTKLDRLVTVRAKAGYAVGSLTVNAGLGIDGMTITFMRVADGKLDPNDSYPSDYIGGPGGNRTTLGGDGSSVIGIVGKSNQNDCTGIGLLLKKK